MASVHHLIGRLWKGSPVLTAAGLLMLVVLGFNAAGLLLDDRLISGAPAWLKPAKFAISTAIYMLTMAWVFGYLGAWPRVRRTLGPALATILVLEIALINLQAARGVASHFNIATPLDTAIFGSMGLMIALLLVLSIVVTVAAFRTSFEDSGLGWAIRLGLLLSVLGSAIGGLMTQPTGAQLAAARETHRMPIAGAHTVGAPDGGPGLPLTRWSLDHGDLRVAHFLGLHALQLLPLIAMAAPISRRRRTVFVAAVSYATLCGILFAQALMGESVVSPGGAIATALLLWFAGTVAAVAGTFVAGRKSRISGASNAVVLS